MSLGGSTLSHRFAFEMDLVRAVHKSIHNGVGERRIADIVVAVLDGKLTGDQSRASPDTVIKQFEQIGTLAWTNGKTGVHYTFYLNTSTVGKDGHGYRTDLTVDLNPLLGANDDQWYRSRSYPNFFMGKDGAWRMQ